MSQLKTHIYRAVSAAPLDLVRRVGGIDVLLPYHHLVSDGPVPHIDPLYPYKNPRQFESDLDYLLRRFKPLDPSILPAAMAGDRELPAGSFLLTFDDGLREVYEVVAPMLLRKGVPAIFFLNPDYLDNRALFYRFKISVVIGELAASPSGQARAREVMGLPAGAGWEELKGALMKIDYLSREKADLLMDYDFDEYLERVRPYMTMEQVREMVGQGFHFGGHSMDHPNYKLLPLAQQLDQTRRSCRFVRESFGLNYTFFSFPHEDADIGQAFFDALAQDGLFREAVFFGTQNQLGEPGNRMLHRFNAERPQFGTDGLVKSMFLYTGLKKMRRQLAVQRKS
jgi:peptidoglycan/xylan/chitin deacetylase (PgdA/CDA1 family)